jgi:hypothetical protein
MIATLLYIIFHLCTLLEVPLYLLNYTISHNFKFIVLGIHWAFLI